MLCCLTTGNRILFHLLNPAAKFKTFGCGSAIASSSLATEWLKGKTLEECMAIKVTASISDLLIVSCDDLSVHTIHPRVVVATLQNTDIASHLKLPPVKLHCSMLAEDAIKAAVQDYKTKNNA